MPIINTREVNGHVRLTSEQRNHMELVNGTKGHCWQGPETVAERLKQMAVHVARHKPEGMTTPWWQY